MKPQRAIRRRLPRSFVLVTLTLAFPGLAALASSTNPDVPDKTLAPYFVILGEKHEGESEPLPLKRTDVDVSISGIIADIEVRQTYHNTGSKVLEAAYLFPGSTRAAVHGLDMKIGERMVAAEIQEREKAKATYEKAKAENKTAALLEQERPNVFRMQVGHILPGDLVEVTLRYTETLVPTDSTYEFVFPGVVGPRYSNTPVDSAAGIRDAWVANPYLMEGVDDPAAFDITVHLEAGMPIQEAGCRTHAVRIDYAAPESAEITLDVTGPDSGNRDYILRYRLAGNEVSSGLLLHEDEERGENFFLLTVQPPARVTPDVIPPREYLFVVDVSGSMNGFPLDTAKALMNRLVGSLRASDQFNILLFAAGSRFLSNNSLPASPANLKEALRWLDGARGGGGTELTAALERALGLPGAENMSRSIVVITDGFVSFERKTFDLVRNQLGNANLFSFGIGSSVNRFLVEGLARAGRGEPFVVTHPDESLATAKQFSEYVSAPVFTGIEVDFKTFDAYDVEPASIPDVFANRPLTIFGKYRGKPKGRIEVSGFTGDGEHLMEIPLAKNIDPENANPALPYLWARQRIAQRADDFSLDKDSEARREVTNLGLTYSLLTEFTSFVAVDTVAREAAPGTGHESVTQPLPLPQHVKNTAVGSGSIPEPALPLLVILFGLFLLLQRHRDLALR